MHELKTDSRSLQVSYMYFCEMEMPVLFSKNANIAYEMPGMAYSDSNLYIQRHAYEFQITDFRLASTDT